MNLTLLKMGEMLYRHTFPLYQYLYFFYKRKTDKYFIDLISQNVRPTMNILDIGANIGFYTLLFSRLVGNGGGVYAFEPSPLNFKRLKKLTSRRPNCYIFQNAASDTPGRLTLYESSSLNVDHRIYDPKETDYTNTYRIPVEVEGVVLDDVIPTGTIIDFIKMDIQGAELKVLHGMKRILSNNKGVRIVSEFWPVALQSAGSSAREVVEYLTNLGFTIQLIDEEKRQLKSLTEDFLNREWGNEAYFNIFCHRS